MVQAEKEADAIRLKATGRRAGEWAGRRAARQGLEEGKAVGRSPGSRNGRGRKQQMGELFSDAVVDRKPDAGSNPPPGSGIGAGIDEVV